MHPSTGQPYILSGSGGKDNSPEGAQVVVHHLVTRRAWTNILGWLYSRLCCRIRLRSRSRLLRLTRSDPSSICEEEWSEVRRRTGSGLCKGCILRRLPVVLSCWHEVVLASRDFFARFQPHDTLNDSPQPHCSVMFGFLKTNLALSLSSCQSISLPMILNSALLSIKTLTPSCSTTSSKALGFSTYSR